MPIYEYVCLDCGEKFDALRSMAQADAPIGCRACEGEHTSRTISVFAAVSEGRVVAGSNGGGCADAAGSCSTCEDKPRAQGRRMPSAGNRRLSNSLVSVGSVRDAARD
jgi:putative FmdB family regulatory protein